MGDRLRRIAPVAVIWAAAGSVLAVIGTYVRDWFSMTDEMRYERLAIAIARTHSLIPRIHGIDIRSYSQLYPLVIAPVFAHGLVPRDLRDAHILGAFFMTSACVPAYLLARRATGQRWAALVVAAAAVVGPWMVYGTTLLTEVVAYPVFVWAVYALARTLAEPSPRNDLATVLLVALAYLARTALSVLVVAVPVALLAYEAGRRERTLRAVVRAHALLFVVYVAAAVGALVLELTGNFSAVFGVYGYYAQNQTLFSSGMAGSFAEHVATFALGVGVVPFLVGAAWLCGALVRPPARAHTHAFACAAAVAGLGVLAQSTIFDVRYTGFVHDRFLLYLLPLVVTATLCAALASRTPRWSFVVPVGAVVCGFVFGAIPASTWAEPNGRFPPDSPAAILYKPLVRWSHGLDHARIALAVGTALLALLVIEASALLSRRALALALAVAVLVAVPGASAYVFVRYLGNPSWSNRPLSNPDAYALTWLDRAIGPNGRAAIIPYPVSTDYFVSQQEWRDLEFWNRSVIRDVHWPVTGDFEYTGYWFPKTYPMFDLSSGTTNVRGVDDAVESVNETRFGVAGKTVAGNPPFTVVRTGDPWRLSWVTLGAWDDGWTKPGSVTRVRLFPAAGQTHAEIRYVSFIMRPPGGVVTRLVSIASNVDVWRGAALQAGPVTARLDVCIPAHGWTEVRLRARGASVLPDGRRVGISLRAVSLSDDVGGACSP
ncbi:MAG: glycosyltransferase family 39 protein [Actinobacteria bacterium]|nr:glycosyltransferase family 39 protein [Actinomycetota bacterium]